MSYRRVRPLLFLGLVPLLMLFELDRELSAGEMAGATARMVLDIVLVLTCAQDLLRPTPKRPRTTAIVFFGAGARLAVLIARSCGKNAHPVIYVAAFLALAIATLTWLSRPRSPEPDSATAESDATKVAGSFPRALAIAVLLPVALVLSGHYGGTWIQALVLALCGLLLPPIAVPRCDDLRPPRTTYFSARSGIACTIVGVALTAGLTGAAHYSLDMIAAAIACTHGSAASHATAFIAKEGAEVVKNVRVAREDIAFFAMTVFVSPLFEERVYRGMLQRIASARFGKGRGIAIAGCAFGLAHLGVYRVAIYQAILLGVTFGITFEEGGLMASIATHAIWNLYLLL